MNSTYAKLVTCDERIAQHMAIQLGSYSPRYVHRWYDKALRELVADRNRIIRSAGPIEYGCELPVDNTRWRMTRQEWAGQD